MDKLPKYATPLLEALKEMARVMVLAAIPIIIEGITNGKLNWQLVGVAAAIAGLRFIDKLLHRVGVEEDNASLSRGLTRF